MRNYNYIPSNEGNGLIRSAIVIVALVSMTLLGI